jgi:hypothetical protein
MVSMVIIKDIIDVAKALFGFRDSLAKAQKDKRECGSPWTLCRA